MKLRKKESETVEFKKSTSELKEAVIDICAMLNKHGKGELYFGIKNDGEICGHVIGASTLRDVSRAIADNIKPTVYPEIKTVSKGAVKYIRVVFSGNAPLYYACGRAYIRTADESRVLTPDEQAKILKSKSGSSWETGLSDKKIDDINQTALKEYLKRAKEAGRLDYKYSSPAAALKKLGFVRNSRLIKAAEILFCDDNPGELKAAVFAGKDKLTFLDIKQYKGNLFELLQKGVDYIREHMDWRADLSGQRRVEIPEVPVRAITEAVVNSLCHRDYESPESNEIAFYKDRVEIYNPGLFPDNMRPEDYLKGSEPSRPRNVVMAGILYYSKDIEKWGSGLKRIYEDCSANGLKVKFEQAKTGSRIVFYRHEQKTVEKTREKTREKILSLIRENPGITTTEMAKNTGLTAKGIEWNLKKMREEKIIKRIGPDKGGYWKVIK